MRRRKDSVEYLVDSIETYNKKSRNGVILSVLCLGSEYLLAKLNYNGVSLMNMTGAIKPAVQVLFTAGGIVGASKALVNKIKLTKNINRLSDLTYTDEEVASTSAAKTLK